MCNARQVNAHCRRMWRVQKGDKPVAYGWRGIDINAPFKDASAPCWLVTVLTSGLSTRFLL